MQHSQNDRQFPKESLAELQAELERAQALVLRLDWQTELLRAEADRSRFGREPSEFREVATRRAAILSQKRDAEELVRRIKISLRARWRAPADISSRLSAEPPRRRGRPPKEQHSLHRD